MPNYDILTFLLWNRKNIIQCLACIIPLPCLCILSYCKYLPHLSWCVHDMSEINVLINVFVEQTCFIIKYQLHICQYQNVNLRRKNYVIIKTKKLHAVFNYTVVSMDNTNIVLFCTSYFPLLSLTNWYHEIPASVDLLSIGYKCIVNANTEIDL